jgi:hypothetical protein
MSMQSVGKHVKSPLVTCHTEAATINDCQRLRCVWGGDDRQKESQGSDCRAIAPLSNSMNPKLLPVGSPAQGRDRNKALCWILCYVSIRARKETQHEMMNVCKCNNDSGEDNGCSPGRQRGEEIMG